MGGHGGAPDQYGVVGHPVAHSWSPFIHGMFAKATAQNLNYRLFDIEPKEFRRGVLALFAAGVRGLNVTLPHKQAAAELVNELTPRAERAQAVNTIAFFDESRLLGDNTDGIGLLNDLSLNLGLELGGKRILLLGSGGAVRGVLAPLLEQAPERLVIANRTPERARELAVRFGDLGTVVGCGFDRIEGPAYDLIVNGTSASLEGKMPALPDHLVGARTVCYDMAYGREPTPFTRWADARHAERTAKGWGMLVEQAAVSFALWRGIRPNTKPVLEALAHQR
jgi:shikimate dehydrogenase